MILKDPRPIAPIHMADTAIEIPIVPKSSNSLDNPCPYWHAPAPKPRIDARKVEEAFKTWFVKGLFALLILYVLVIVFIFLGKLLVLVTSLK